MKENQREGGLLVRAQSLHWAKEISHRTVDEVRVENDALLLEVDPQCLAELGCLTVKEDESESEVILQINS